jgi:predicted DNA-binding protein with PD1-like motif
LDAIEDRGVLVVRLHDGDDFVPSLLNAFERVGLRYGAIVSGLGMLRDFEIGWLDSKTHAYRKGNFALPHELLSLSGSVAVTDDKDAKVMPHMHASLAGPDHSVVGGHLFKATTNVLNEVFVMRLDAPLRRRLNPATGIMELVLPKM